MPDPLLQIPLEDLKKIADILEATAEKLRRAHKSFEQAKISNPWTRWSDEVPRRAAAMAAFADNTLAEMPDQLHSKSLGIQPEIERRKERSMREIGRRKNANTAVRDVSAILAPEITPPEFVKQPGTSQSPSPGKKPAKKAAKKKGAT